MAPIEVVMEQANTREVVKERISVEKYSAVRMKGHQPTAAVDILVSVIMNMRYV